MAHYVPKNTNRLKHTKTQFYKKIPVTNTITATTCLLVLCYGCGTIPKSIKPLQFKKVKETRFFLQSEASGPVKFTAHVS